MKLQTANGNILISSDSLIINCKIKHLNNIFKELYKLVPKQTKIKDIKHIISEKISLI